MPFGVLLLSLETAVRVRLNDS